MTQIFDREAIELLIQAMGNYEPFNAPDEEIASTVNSVGLQVEAYAIAQGWQDLANESRGVRRLTADLCHDMSTHDWRNYEVTRPDRDAGFHRTIRCKKCGESRSHRDDRMGCVDIEKLPVWGEKNLSALKDRVKQDA
jgi:hypothetical protein